MAERPRRLGDILIERGLITESLLSDALAEQKRGTKSLGSILVEMGVISSANLAEVLAEQLGLPLIDLKLQHLDFDLASKFSSSLIIDNQCFPLNEDDEAYTIAIVNPLDVMRVSKLEEEARPKRINLAIASGEDMRDVLRSYQQYISQGIRRKLKEKLRKNMEGRSQGY
jgi:hypothetical protein